MRAFSRTYDLRLIHPFGISRGTVSTIPTFHLELEGGGIGEGSPVRYKNQSAAEGAELVRRLAEALDPVDADALEHALDRARRAVPHHSSALACLDLALHDRLGRQLGVPLHRLFGLPRAEGVPSSFTIGLDTDDAMVAKVAEARGLPHLKIKLGRNDPAVDCQTLRRIRAEAPTKVLRVDANAGWSLATARQCIRAAADLGVEFIEQPLAIGNLEELAVLKRECPLPIIADEDVQDAASLPALMGKVDGINIKLMKCGGLAEARRMIGFCRAVGWRVMLGCMIESSVGIAAASHLAGAAECFDLDSEQLVSNNPAGPGVLDPEGRLWTPDRPGLGVDFHSPVS